MARRLAWFVGVAALVLVLARLGRVLEPAVDTPDWRLILPVATIGGILVTWATAKLSLPRQIAVHVLSIALLVLRVAAADTLSYGVIPGPETLPTLGERLAYALDIVRFGAPPVLAVAGLVALLAVATWCLGAVWAGSVATGTTWTGLVPPLAFYLYLAVVDRGVATLGWNIAFALLAALGLVATSNVVPSGAGHLRSLEDRPLPRWQAGPGGRIAFGSALLGLVGVTVLGSFIPAGGALDWRTPGGEGTGSGSGGFSASRFAGLRQSILSLSDEPVFIASVEPERPEGTAGYWRLLTLDRYTGQEWVAGDDDFDEVAPDVVDSPAAGAGVVVQTVQIESLRDDRLPSYFIPEQLASTDPVIRSGASLGNDGNLRLNALTFQGLTYRVESSVPNLDISGLASADGQLTPLFAEAAESGDLPIDATEGTAPPRPAAIDAYLSLPSMDPAITGLARGVTADASSPFEQALMLEDFLRTFSYSTNVSTGHSSLDLLAWLTDPESPNYRTGYCEQFAAAMAVMGRALSLPTRVVIGFTAGEAVETPDGPLTIVRERNAHAWVEVWLDGQGWVGFDPTPRSDGATSPMIDTVGIDPSELGETADVGETQIDSDVPDFIGDPGDVPVDVREGIGSTGGTGLRLPVVAAITLLVAAAAALPAIKAWRTGQRLRRARSGDITAAWEEIVDRLTDLGVGPRGHQTPLEYAEATAPELVPLARAYSSAIYGGRSGHDVDGHLHTAGMWIDRSFDRSQRTRSVFSTRSLRK